jgi:hypothetical protein
VLAASAPRLPLLGSGTLTQNEMVVSKLWLAGHTTQDLKPYTRHESVSGGEKTRRSWLASSGTASSASLDHASSRDDGYASSAVENLPPLAQLLASPDSGREPDGADPSSGGHVDDVVSLLVESVALNSTANIIVDGEGTCVLPARAALLATSLAAASASGVPPSNTKSPIVDHIWHRIGMPWCA